ncbi:MAG: hypothetical protein NTU98_11315 [Bacteroidetes bacterium]|nr:hypothetical protein [Bacteroidota bacterium]
MEAVFIIYGIVQIILVIGLSMVATLIVLRYYFSHKKQVTPSTPQGEDTKIILPLRLQAYERIVLFLERIAPNSLIMRVNRPVMTAAQLQASMTRTIREEFEYNLSQQLYISSKAWEMVRNAKEETIRLINSALTKVPETAQSSEMIRVLLDLLLSEKKSAVDAALDEIKKEVQKTF